MRSVSLLRLSLISAAIAAAAAVGQAGAAGSHAAATVDASRRLQRIDGFGVNVTPAQWRGGALRPALDRLVDDLGVSLVRLDCYGKADWLDPAQQQPDGGWAEAYLARVYGSPVFSDCWQTSRYLASKGVDVHLNVSGVAPRAWTAADGKTLVNLDAYASMVVSLAKWARAKEGLRFTTFAPFNETDIGPPEGPLIATKDLPAAVRAVVRRLDGSGMGDVRLVVMCDSSPAPTERYRELRADAALAPRIAAFSSHTYGDGDEGDRTPGWYDEERPMARFAQAAAASPSHAAAWLTEYGDLDQTGAIEWQFAWRSTRRLLKALEDGFDAAFAWDAFDNLHEHDGAWAEYGLLRTDRASWTYAPKKRYFAAKQVYRFVRPGWVRIDVARPKPEPTDVYATWHDLGRHVRLAAFASPDGAELTIVGTNRVESDVTLELSLRGIAPAGAARPFAYVRTTPAEDARPVGELRPVDGILRVVVPPASIFTLTTLR